VFIGGLYVLAAQEMDGLLNHLGLQAEAQQWMDQANRIAETVLTSGWDGAWFRRAYDDFGRPVGSRECAEGQIFIEPQGICVMAGLGLQDGRAGQALASVEERLATPHGIILQQPAYSHYYVEYGEISSYPPGYKENAGIFCHTNPWIMIAEAMAGHGEQAFQYYQRINPSYREDISEVHRCEPYVYAQMIAGRDAPTHGEAKNSWLSGTASWNYVAITQWILGIRPEWEGLVIAPVIPGDWPGFQAERQWRGVRYSIQVERQGPGNGVELWVNGQPMPGNRVPLPPAGVRQISVKAILR
jgi:cellobiose phosphorylase